MKEPENLRHDIIGLLRNKLFKEMAQIFNFPQIGHFVSFCWRPVRSLMDKPFLLYLRQVTPPSACIKL